MGSWKANVKVGDVTPKTYGDDDTWNVVYIKLYSKFRRYFMWYQPDMPPDRIDANIVTAANYLLKVQYAK